MVGCSFLLDVDGPNGEGNAGMGKRDRPEVIGVDVAFEDKLSLDADDSARPVDFARWMIFVYSRAYNLSCKSG